jgi:hypothetical protein
MLENYQNAAEIIVQIVYAVVVVTILVGAVAGLRLLFGKRVGRIRNTDVSQHDSD